MNVAEVVPPFTVTEAGACNAVLEADNATATPAAGAAPANATVHVLVAFCPKVRGLQERVEICGAETRLMAAVTEVLRVAVTVAV